MRSLYVDALLKEYELRRGYLPEGEPIRTIYLGGGTPSQLGNKDLERLLRALPVKQAEEVTIEANPSDMTEAKLKAWRAMGINRLSIGVQSFDEVRLAFLNRRHGSKQAKKVIRLAQELGYDNISIDLMYALPNQTLEQWQADVETALTFDVQHISTYCLSYEPGTPLDNWRKKGLFREVDEDLDWRKKGLFREADEDLANAMYAHLCRRLREAGYEHYEVSNFAKPGFESRHNSSYWDETPYLGLGAGAHSYDGVSRQWNVANLKKYISEILKGKVPFKREKLTETERYNERVMLGLRTSKGITATDELLHKAQPYLETGKLRVTEGKIIATQDGINILNTIITDLMRD